MQLLLVVVLVVLIAKALEAALAVLLGVGLFHKILALLAQAVAVVLLAHTLVLEM
jgi:hypothetical protein